jgi:hypothetical protein
MKRTWICAGALLLALGLTACGGTDDTTIGAPSPVAGSSEAPGSGTGDGTGSDATTGPAEESETQTSEGTSSGETSERSTISISNDPQDALYSQGVMQAPSESPLLISYNNPSPDEHNWVLVEPGQEQAVADAAEAQGGNPEGVPGVIAWSEIVADDTVEVEIEPLERGSYPYICTVPGHYEAGHKGALNVR